MEKVCDACEFLKKPKHQILVTNYWNAGLGNNQAYLGRAYVTLRSHKGSLNSLSEEEWHEFEEIVRKLEKAYKAVYGAEPLNWGCYMNLAFREEPFNPHVHWHVFPRYKKAPVLGNMTFDDPLYGSFYDNDAEKLLDDGVVEQIAAKLRHYLEIN
jgi:ATP adenylyltransferase